MDLSQKILEEFKFDSYKDLFSCVLYDKNLCLNEYIFRGIGSKTYDLIPSVLREGCQLKLWEWIADSPPKSLSNTEFMQHQLEINLLHEFYRISNKHGLKVPKSSFFEKNPLAPGVMNLFHFANVFKWIPPELYDITCLAQHYSVPTRLLDWSFDFMTALFFAVVDGLKNYDENNSIIVWALANDLEYMRRDIPLKYIVPHYFDNPNIKAQTGVLTLWETALANNRKNRTPLVVKPLDSLVSEYFLSSSQISTLPIFYKFIIPHNQLKLINRVLNNMGYNEAKIFPGYDGVVKYMKNKKYKI